MAVFIISVILLATIFINFYPEKVNSENLMDGKVAEVYPNGFLIESESNKSCMAYLMDETVFKGSRTPLIEIGDYVVVEHTGQVFQTNLDQVYCKRIWKN